jgi:hypothetical protein
VKKVGWRRFVDGVSEWLGGGFGLFERLERLETKTKSPGGSREGGAARYGPASGFPRMQRSSCRVVLLSHRIIRSPVMA